MTLHTKANQIRVGRDLSEQEILFVSGGTCSGTDNPPDIGDSGIGEFLVNNDFTTYHPPGTADAIIITVTEPTISEPPTVDCPSTTPPFPE